MGKFNLDEYEPVEDRLRSFWNDHPQGRVLTDLVAYSETQFICRAEVYRDDADARPWATGYAEEQVTARGVNQTSALENCETSAIGRALANAGYAAKGKRPSREEMQKVERRQRAAAPPVLDDEELGRLANVIRAVPAMGEEQMKAVWHAHATVLDLAVDVNGVAVTLREAILDRKAALDAEAVAS